MELVAIILSILIVTFSGYVVCDVLAPDIKEALLKISLAFGVGFGLISFQMLLFDILKIKWSYLTIFLPWLIFDFIAVFFRAKHLKPEFSRFRGSKIIFTLIILLLLFALIQTLIRPVVSWDAIASWYIGGKAFFLNKSIDPSYYYYINYDYPPFMHIMLASVNLFLKEFNDNYSLIFYFLFFPFLLSIFYFMLRNFFSSTKALTFTFLLGATQNLIRHAGRFDIGNSDLPLAFYFLISIYFLQKFLKTNRTGPLILTLLCLTSSAMIKNDGIPFAVFCFLIISYRLILKKRYAVLFLLPVLASPFIYWRYFILANHLPNTIYFLSNFQIQRFWTVTTHMGIEFFNFQRWNLIWLFILISFISFFNFKKLWPLGVIILIQFMSYVVVYLISPIEPAKQIPNSFDRLLLQILPITFYFAAILGAKNKRTDK